MPDIRKVIDAASLPVLPGTELVHWPALVKIDFSHNEWHFHYSDGTVVNTKDCMRAEYISRQHFGTGVKSNLAK